MGNGAFATDNCSEVTYSNNFTTLNVDCDALTEVMFFAEDACGNRDTAIANLMIRDTEAPIIVAPADITVTCDEEFNLIDATATDNCTPAASIVITSSLSESVNTCEGGDIIRTIIATDICGNADTVTQRITVLPDTQAPVFTSALPSDIRVAAGQEVPVQAVLEATDLCSEVGVAPTEVRETIECGYILTRTWLVTDECGNDISHTQIVTVDVPLLASIAGDGTVDCNDPNAGGATVTVQSGQSPYEYLWDNGETTSTASSLDEGVHTVTVTDVSGCQVVLTVDVIGDFEAPEISAFTGGTLTCNDDILEFNITTNGTITSLSGPDTNTSVNNPSATIPGIYTLMVTSDNGCTAVATVEVLEDVTLPTANLGFARDGEIGCNDSAVSLVASSNGTIDSLYGPDVNTSVTNPVATVPGLYTLLVSGVNGCTNLAQVTVTEETCIPGISLTKLTNGKDLDEDNMPVIIIPDEGNEVMWTFIVSNTGNVPLTDVVVVDDVEGEICTIPTLGVGETETCTLIGDAIRGQYQNVATVSGSANGEVITDQDTSAYIGVFINVEKRADKDTICAGDDVNYTLIIRMLGGGPGIQIGDIRVNDNNVNNEMTVNSPQFNADSDVNSNGFVDFIDDNNDGKSDEEFLFQYTLNPEETLVNIAKDTGFIYFNGEFIGVANNMSMVTVVVDESKCECVALDLETTSTNSICESDNGSASVTALNGDGDYTYLWSNGADTPTISDVAPGTYSVIVTDGKGCIGETSVTITTIESSIEVNVNVAQSASCALGDVGIAMVIPTGGTAPYLYEWSDGQTDNMATNLAAATYTVVVTDANGCEALAIVVIDEIQDCNACLGDFVWEDLDRNGIQDTLEPGMSNVDVRLLDEAGSFIREVQTDANGFYSFDSLKEGSYIIEFQPADEYLVTLPNQGRNDDLDSDINLSTARSSVIVINTSVSIKNVDAGFYRTGSIGDFVWLDIDCDGIQDTDEPGVEGIRVELHTTDGDTLASTVTDVDGLYRFNNLPIDDYRLKFVSPEGFGFTSKDQGDDDTRDSDVDSTGISDLIALISGANIPDYDAGLKGFVDITVNKSVNTPTVQLGDTVSFTITVQNLGNMMATGVDLEDELPNGYESVINLTGGATVNAENIISWTGLNIDVNEIVTFTYDAIVVSEIIGTPNFRNVAQVVFMNQLDIDSNPGNDDGDQSEDDEDFAQVTISECDVTLEVSATAALCASDNGTATVVPTGGNAPYVFLWSNGDNSTTITGLTPGMYNVMVTDASGCSSTASIEVTRSESDIEISLDVQDESCDLEDGNINATVVNGTSPYSYEWSNGSTASSIGNLGAGMYSVTVTDANGCTAEASSMVSPAVDCPQEFIDLELIKRVNNLTPQPGDTVNFLLTLFNNSETDATGVTVVDDVPSGFEIIESAIDNDGVVTNISSISWSGRDLPALSLVRYTYRAIVLAPDGVRTYKNVAQVTAADQQDVDSTPNNDDGDQSEDDEDAATAMPEMADVAIFKSVSDVNPDIRDLITYEIRVVNEGSTPLTRVEVTDYLPTDFCTNFTNISNSGIYLIDRIIWTDINLAPGESTILSFDATVSSSSFGETVINAAEVTDMDQTDMDSTPSNDDGDQSEDDESAATFVVGSTMADVEVLKDVNKLVAMPNEEVEFTIQVKNNGPGIAYGVTVADIIPDGYGSLQNISNNGTSFRDRIVWIIDELGVDSIVTLTFDARVIHYLDRECDYVNIARIESSFTADAIVDNNEDTAELEVDLGTGCVTIETAVFLEGPYNPESGEMITNLNRLGYLPGQLPTTFIGRDNPTPAGHPYSRDPWFYNGSEGDDFVHAEDLDAITGLNAGYPTTAVDWVLVSLRSDASASSTVCETSAILHSDGRVELIEGFACCNIDPTEDYYIVIEHRNHLIVMSHIEVPVINGVITYDFRVRESYRSLFGFGQKEVSPGKYVMFAGNGEQSTLRSDEARDINPNDLVKWLIQNGQSSGYFDSDFNFAGEVTVSDKSLFLRNNGIFSDVPRE